MTKKNESKNQKTVKIGKINVHSSLPPQIVSGVIGTYTPGGMFQFSLFFDRVSEPSLDDKGEQSHPGVVRDVYATYLVPRETCKNLGEWFIEVSKDEENLEDDQ